jgi:hypothetical protein
MIELFTTKEDQIGIMDFLTYIKYFIGIEAGFGSIKSDG